MFDALTDAERRALQSTLNSATCKLYNVSITLADVCLKTLAGTHASEPHLWEIRQRFSGAAAEVHELAKLADAS